jgi:hypothetical protein
MWFLGKRETVNAWKKADIDGFRDKEEIDNNFGYAKITQLADNIPLKAFELIRPENYSAL